MTRAQELGITKFPYFEYDNFNNISYYEEENGEWYKNEFNNSGDIIYHLDSEGDWYEKDYNSCGILIYRNGSKFYSYNFFRYYDGENFIREIKTDCKSHYKAYKRNLTINNILNE